MRPSLPLKHANPYLKNFTAASLPPVKYQILSCQGAEILVGRLKIEVPETGHAFILRRYDTSALSATTLFRAAFPTSSEHDEKLEIQYIKDTFDLAGTNGSSREPHLTRLAGTWVKPQTALVLAREYGLEELVRHMVDATPDPAANYRRSHKATQNAPSPAPPAPTTTTTTTTTIAQTQVTLNGSPAAKPPGKVSALPTPSPTGGAPAAKRRKEEPSPGPAAAPATPAPAKTPVRRSARAKSPAVKSGPVPLTGLTSKPRSRSSVAPPSPKKVVQPKLPVVEDEEEGEGEGALESGVAGRELYEEDVRAQKELIADLKRKREAEGEATVVEQQEEEGDVPAKGKRVRQDEEEPLRFEFKEPETEERQIATNRRVGRFEMEPRTKSIAWGLAAFAVGMSAVSFLPNFL